jgi:monofunctional biosynthetic peptidoglycan transglycosylase
LLKSFFSPSPATDKHASEPHLSDKPASRLKRALLSPITGIRRLIFVTGLFVWLCIGGLALYAFQILKAVPERETLSFEQVRSYAQSINLTNSINSRQANQKNWTDLKDVNRDLLYAIVLSEDAHFFSHNGIDYDALIAALAENIKSQEWRFGASTISQQTAKNLYLTNNKTLSRKLQELLITYRLEDALSKNEILELYLNLIEFGPELYGIGNACAYYFNNTPADINAAEGAYLALLMPSPRKYHYTLFQNGNWSPALMKKHQRILRDMRFKELISIRQYKRYQEWRYDKTDYFSD